MQMVKKNKLPSSSLCLSGLFPPSIKARSPPTVMDYHEIKQITYNYIFWINASRISNETDQHIIDGRKYSFPLCSLSCMFLVFN